MPLFLKKLFSNPKLSFCPVLVLVWTVFDQLFLFKQFIMIHWSTKIWLTQKVRNYSATIGSQDNFSHKTDKWFSIIAMTGEWTHVVDLNELRSDKSNDMKDQLLNDVHILKNSLRNITLNIAKQSELAIQSKLTKIHLPLHLPTCLSSIDRPLSHPAIFCNPVLQLTHNHWDK